MARPAMASGPAPRPMKIESHRLYMELADMAMMLGVANCINNLPTGLVAN